MSKIVDIIKYEGDNSTFIWKHPCEDFNSLTQLIVHESQEAIFFMNGQALDLFGPGRYTLETQNIPKIGKFLNRTTNGETPFHCEVYFINQTVQMDVKWGTDSKVRYIDAESGLPIEIGACGSMNIKVCNSRKLLVNLVGTTNGIAWEDQSGGFTKSLQNSFRPMISTMVKSNLSPAIKSGDFDIFEIDEHLEEISRVLHQKILPEFEEFGITIPQFYLTTIVLPDNDPNFRRLKDLHTIALQQRVIEAEAKVHITQAKSEADVTAAKRQIEIEKQTTQTEIARHEAERKAIEAQGEASAASIDYDGEIRLNYANSNSDRLYAEKYVFPVINIELYESDSISINNGNHNKTYIGNIEIPETLLDRIDELLISGSELSAIKLLKDETGSSLIEAKEWVSNYEKNNSKKYQHTEENSEEITQDDPEEILSKGCLTLIAVVLFVFFLIGLFV